MPTNQLKKQTKGGDLKEAKVNIPWFNVTFLCTKCITGLLDGKLVTVIRSYLTNSFPIQAEGIDVDKTWISVTDSNVVLE